MLSDVQVCYFSTLHLHMPFPVQCDLTYQAHTVPVYCKLDAIITHVVVYLEFYWCIVLFIYICTYFAFVSSFNFLNNLKSNINLKSV
jgi:hypothetical protein